MAAAPRNTRSFNGAVILPESTPTQGPAGSSSARNEFTPDLGEWRRKKLSMRLVPPTNDGEHDGENNDENDDENDDESDGENYGG